MQPVRVIVIGGGYAGLATIVGLRSIPGTEVQIHLLDPGEYHVKLTALHETFDRSLDEVRVPYEELAQRFGFCHHRWAPPISDGLLQRWQNTKRVALPGCELGFDFLVVATGARPVHELTGNHILGQLDFCDRDARALLAAFLHDTGPGGAEFTVVGAGASGIQFLFALEAALRKGTHEPVIRLVSLGSRLLRGLPAGFERHVLDRLDECGIEYLPETVFVEQNEAFATLQEAENGRRRQIRSDLTLVFPGVRPWPQRLVTNRYGQVRIDGRVLANVYAAGDCSEFASSGLNALTAQAAVRKGKQVAVNIRRQHEGRMPRIYSYRESGYFLSTGPGSGVGWLGLRSNVVTGLPAFAIKEVIEAQYSLFLDGLDTYIDL